MGKLKFDCFKVGDRIRSYDFICCFSSYVEGEVVAVLKAGDDPEVNFDCYKVVADKRLVDYVDVLAHHGEVYYVPKELSILEHPARIMPADLALYAGIEADDPIELVAKYFSDCRG